jgi:uncharacterized protein (TIGR02145 family)
MKKIILLFTLSFSLLNFVNAQTPPNAFNYSAVARNAAGQPIVTTTIGIQVSILKTSPTGASQYSENHFVNTDAYGLFNLVIGAGAVQSGSMATIDWSNDNYYLKVGMDANGGTNFLTMGTTQLLSVPYALYAKSAGSVSGGSNFSGNYNDLTNTPTNVSSFNNDAGYLTNENQQLSVSNTGDTLYLQNGGFVIIPGISAANNQGGGGNGIFTPGNGVTFDGYAYQSIVLGNGQEWMAENLRTTVYANGDPIPNETDPNQWSSLTTGAWSHYNNDSQYENPYGKLYNWYTVADTRNMCPTGWHVPSNAEWTYLTDYLGGGNIAGGKMKSIGTQYWTSPNTDATNVSGFSGLPGAFRIDYGPFPTNFGSEGWWWSSSEEDAYYGSFRYLSYNQSFIGSVSSNYKETGMSVRCIKN